MSLDAALIGGLLTNLVPLNQIGKEFLLIWSFKKDVEKLTNRLSSINAALEDAETKIKLEKKDKQTEDWLRKLKVVAYEVRDVMDDCRFEDLRLQVKRLNASSSTLIQVTNCIAHPFSNCTWTRLKIGHKIKDVLEKLDQFSSDPIMFQLPETTRDSTPTSSRQTISKLSGKVYGRDKEKKKIVDILIHTSPDALSVIPILGLGGLGKTTLAQIVFNDEKVTKYFDVKFWVCVSEVFDIHLVIKAIIGATNETSLEILQNKIQDKLRGKKYLIVLDDVWNDNIEEWNHLRSILDCGSNGSFILTTTRKKNVAEIMKTRGVQLFELSSLSFNDCWKLFEERAFMYGTQKTTNLIDIGKEIAKKCKGVPLVAKTLGGNLGFKSNEEEWQRIKDNEIWEIFENEKSLLHIPKLSYYDLPYILRRCFAFCAIFPKDTEIEKEMLIQLWMAHDLIPINKNQEGENHGNTIWDELCWRCFFQDEKEEISWGTKTFQKTCKMHDLMHELAKFLMKDECYTMDGNNSSENFTREIRHLTIMMEELRQTSIDSIKNIGGLQSIIFANNCGKFSKEILSVFKELPSLRVLRVPLIVESQDLRDVGCLKHLRYLNLSSCRVITLPNDICDLLNLQTLNLNDCEILESLPRNMKDLINLQHLYLDGCDNLRYMPGGMGRLEGLKTLSLVVVGKKIRDCQLDEFKELKIRGSLKIKNLERVSDASITRGVSMAKMSSINKLELEWEYNGDNNDQTEARHHEKICEALKVSSTCLKILRMDGYKGVNIPKWMGEYSSATLTQLRLWSLDNVEHIFTMNNMSFPLLEELSVGEMKNLRELVSPLIPITTTIGAFPNLNKIYISGCPKLGAFSPHLKSPNHLRIVGKCSDELINSIPKLGEKALSLYFKSLEDVFLFGDCSAKPLNRISDFRGLTYLTFENLGERSVLFGGGNYYKADGNENENEITAASSSTSTLAEDNINEAQGGPAASSTFQSLRYLDISNCPKLSCLFDEERGVEGCLAKLNSLSLHNCPELMISLEQWRILTHSLRYLSIIDCPMLVPSKVEEANEVHVLLRSLRQRLGSDHFYGDILNEEQST